MGDRWATCGIKKYSSLCAPSVTRIWSREGRVFVVSISLLQLSIRGDFV